MTPPLFLRLAFAAAWAFCWLCAAMTIYGKIRHPEWYGKARKDAFRWGGIYESKS